MNKSSVDIKEGDVFEIDYPFSRTVYLDQEGGESQTWNPKPYYIQTQYDEGVLMADANGKCVLTVVSVHRPGKFPTRVFYTRKFINPDGATFGKSKLIIKTVGVFRKYSAGYMEVYKIEDRGIEAAWKRYRKSMPFLQGVKHV